MLPQNFFNQLMTFEGNYSNHPNDSGGETIYGITIKHDEHAFKLVKRFYDKSKLFHAIEIARIVYDADYYQQASCYRLEDADIIDIIIHQVFDMAVNMGVKRSIKILQKAINTHNNDGDVDIAVDGIFGNETLTHLQQINNNIFSNTLVDERIKYYENLVTAKPKNSVFLKGWKSRANWFRQSNT